MTDQPYQGLCPYITIADRKSLDALDFYGRAFGARPIVKYPTEDGKSLMHCQVEINGSALMFGDAMPDNDAQSGGSVALHLEVADPDAWWKRAVDAGATVRVPLDDQFWGARWGQLSDPFGNVWGVNGPIKS